eukprot:CAMPEP_0119122432 /NCGR_PEP_ID=MMETSP1310-20130426/2690_1 /TAXON_ID=464262 /ORGANISM="Genus nov. species nov., Strain RCC2339" /LENGTH=484 /DNA_ID=CAMNT_0007112087 /DNA_START=40 /DNA_END=1494 /DNA_ORIENTATION=-
MRVFVLAAVLVALVALVEGRGQTFNPHESLGMNKVMPLKEVEYQICVLSGKCPTLRSAKMSGDASICENGVLELEDPEDLLSEEDDDEVFPCSNVDVQSFVPVNKLTDEGRTPRDASDIWGDVVEVDGQKHYLSIINLMHGTSVVDVTDSTEPVVLGFLPAPGMVPIIWHDVKVDNHFAFIVSEQPGHGMQVLDLTRVVTEYYEDDDDDDVPVLSADFWLDSFGSSHNIVINEETDFAYVVGASNCDGGLYVVDISDPLKSNFVACYSDDGYTHDAQVVVYDGPDQKYKGKEIAFNYNEDTLTIVDVTDKSNMVLLSRTSYQGHQYTHQGWLTADSSRLLMNDELDEQYGTTFDNSGNMQGGRTRTLIWNVEDLENPYWENSFIHENTSIDHNLYINNDFAYLANYCSGLRILDVAAVASGGLPKEVAYFDACPECAGTLFNGVWSSYPYFTDHPDQEADEQIVLLSSIERGLFVVKVHLPRAK